MDRGNSNHQWQQQQAHEQQGNIQEEKLQVNELSEEVERKAYTLNKLMMKSAQKRAANAQLCQQILMGKQM